MRRIKGFTLIEVALVLAIAGLIFMMVFITLPTVWANQRDSARRDDMLTLVQRLKNFQSNNNRGALPSMNNATSLEVTRSNSQYYANTKDTWFAFYYDYLDQAFKDPAGNDYRLEIGYCSKKASSAYTDILDYMDKECDSKYGAEINKPPKYPNDEKVYVLIGAKCEGEKAVGSANIRKVAVLYKLEGGGVYCGES